MSQVQRDFSGTVFVEQGDGIKNSSLTGVKTPGSNTGDADEEIRVPLSKPLAKSYRGLAALANFMPQDQADLGFAAKEVSKLMAEPAVCDIPAVKRMGRYLTLVPSCGIFFAYQYPAST